MIGKLAATAAALFLVSCADPKYASPGGGTGPQEKSAGTRAEMPASNVSVWLTWEKLPAGQQFGSFVLKFGRENLGDKSPLPLEIEGDVSVVLWMPSMGHGSSPVKVEKLDTGTYRASKVFFTMPGDWEIRIQRNVNGAMVDQTVIALRI